MSNRFNERVTSAVTTSGGTGGDCNANVVQQAGINVAGPITPDSPNAFPVNPLFSVGAVQFAILDGQIVALPYYTAGQNPSPVTSTLEDSLRVKRGETQRAEHLALTTLPTSSGVAIFTNQPAYDLVPGTAKLTYWVTYYPNAAVSATNQQVLFQPYWGNGVDEMPDTGVDPGSFPGSGTTSLLTLYNTQMQINAVEPGDPNVQIVFSFDVPAGATTCRLLAKQSSNDDLTACGSVSIYITTSS